MTSTSPERLRIARELHDGIAQDLVGLGYSLDLILSDPDVSITSRAALRKSRLEVDALITKVREEILELRRDSSEGFDLQLASLIRETCVGLTVERDISVVMLDSTQTRELTLISQEILRNVVTHAGATHLEVKLFSVNNRLFLEFFDNGVGGAHMSDHRWGLQGISERIHALGGELTLESKEGTRISISL